ncbi:tRNA (adenosine(37)-N6)-threonylcarbamoyltransferase complex ATPase subunit type 1 TsaE [Filibacter tadaridae]|uniref:tRNA threonylcarbamoyladenosine biosynthesis protein TsaE n=1 Tax=Filibacter tadaridae TaxID=2483811 RepID=A0A3P5XB22_9BACL|nr:tRNA (adenosine(37)-N6)-threonylcarbamoyltransferase complex ATPase subunit type 1 TsaE [Filibacter tadaridae]VDC25677.1 tRNA threonylcarbamoyladenosine biosynthesis protein TsaE [Filibacter tadaridae]
MTKEIRVHSVQETEQIAEKLAALLTPPDVITLEGDLGAGKTTFTKALAKGLGVTRTVNSPTFTIIKQYEGFYPFNHLDVYRLADSDEDLGWDELFFGDAITVVEWAHLIEADLPSERLEIRLTHCGGDERMITITPIGPRYEEICEGVFQ